METCHIPNCNQSVSKLGHKLCYEHWKVDSSRATGAPATALRPIVLPTPKPVASSSPISVASSLLSTTKISELLGLSKNKVNPILAELGLIDKVPNGWVTTRLGLSFGAVQKQDEKNGKQYVIWSDAILTNQIFIGEFYKVNDSEDEKQTLTESSTNLGFRQKYPAGDWRTTDGHWVRSKAELLIDNWLYMESIVHAYERKLPIEEEAYCDFYIPSGKVYIEYWGYEQDPKYLARKLEKQHLYEKNGFKLAELSDEHVRNLDDHLPQVLRGFGIALD